jgi:hypothetical protein
LEDIKIPPRLTKIPAWITGEREPGSDLLLDEQMVLDVRSLIFWRQVEDRARADAAKATRKHLDFKPGIPLEEQPDIIKQEFEIQTKIAEDRLVALLEMDIEYRTRLVAQSFDIAYDRLETIKQTSEVAVYRLVYQASKEGMLPLMQGEFSTIDEFLASKTHGSDNKDVLSSISFFTNYLVPVLENNGFSPNLIYGVLGNFWKAREAVPFLRQVLGEVITKVNTIRGKIEATKDEEERLQLERALDEVMKVDTRLHDTLETLVDEMIKTIRDGGMSQKEFRKDLARKASGNPDPPEPAQAFVYDLGGKTLISITIDDRTIARAIQQRLSSLVEFTNASPKELAKEVARLLAPDVIL